MRLLVALGLSLSLHVGLAVASLVRSLREPVPGVTAPQMATKVVLFDVVAPPAAQESPKPAAARPVHRTVAAIAGPGDAPSPAVTEEAPDEPGDGDGEAVVPRESAAQAGPVAAAPAPVAARSFDVTALHAALAAAAQRCYPKAAQRYGLTGEAQVELCLDAAGALTSTRVVRSTGQELLDTAARDCVVAGAMPLPTEANGACYTVPVRFGR